MMQLIQIHCCLQQFHKQPCHSFLQIQTKANSPSMKPMRPNPPKMTSEFKTLQPSSLRQREEGQCYYNIVYPSNKIQCDDCRRDISAHTKIFCNDLDYCLSCFANSHPFPESYHVINQLNFPLFEGEWTAQEELLLFEGLQKFGFGNWTDIAELVGGGKSSDEAQKHYLTVYLQNNDFLPTANLLVNKEINGRLIKINNQKKTNNSKNKNETYSHSQPETQGHHFAVKSSDNPAEIVGYLPLRRQFEVQYDNDAELLLAELEFNDDDSQEEIAMKFRIIDIYNQKLNERIRRKDFVIDRGLVDLKEQTRLDKGRTKQEKEIYNMMKIFSRFNSSEDHEKLVRGIIKEKELRERVMELKELKAKGYRTLAEYKADMDQRDKLDASNKSKKNSSSFSDSRNQRTRKSKREALVQKQQHSYALTSEEQAICLKFGITTKQFVLIKETMIREAVKQGVISRQSTRQIFKIQRNIVDGIFDFLISKQEIGVKLK